MLSTPNNPTDSATRTFSCCAVRCTISAAAPDDLLDDVVVRLGELHRSWTRFDPDSDLERLNDHAGAWVEVPWHLAAALRAARVWCARSGGTFDPTVDLAAVGYDRSFEMVGAHEGVARPRPSIGIDAFDVRGMLARVAPGRRVDLGGIGKGVAADLALAWLTDAGATNIWVDLGGDVRCDHPVSVTALDHLARPWCRWRIIGGGIATSSPSARRWTRGTEMHHILDPATGSPAAGCFDVVSCHAATTAAAEAATKAVLVTSDVEVAARFGAVAAARHGDDLLEWSSGAQRWADPVVALPHVAEAAPNRVRSSQ